MSSTVEEILKQYLKANGYAGLAHPDTECGCLLDDLIPCGSYFAKCQPEYHGRDYLVPLPTKTKPE